MGDLGTEELLNALDGRERVFDDVMEEPCCNRNGVELHVGEEVGNRERVDEIRFARMTHLSPVFERREDVRTPEQLDVGVRAVCPDLFKQVLEANHGKWCLNPY